MSSKYIYNESTELPETKKGLLRLPNEIYCKSEHTTENHTYTVLDQTI